MKARASVSSTFEKYGARPLSLEHMTFKDYYKKILSRERFASRASRH